MHNTEKIIISTEKNLKLAYYSIDLCFKVINPMEKRLTRWTVVLISILVFFALTPISIYGYYSDTAFLIIAFILICWTIVQRIKNNSRKLLTAFFIICLFPIGYVIYKDLDFHLWGIVKSGTVKSIEEANKKSDFIIKVVYYQLKDKDEAEQECLYWEKASLKYFPILEWTLLENINSCGEIEELNKNSR